MTKVQYKEIPIIFWILILWEIISLFIWNYYSSDVSGWWPIILFIMSLIYWVYSILFYLINKINPQPIKYFILYNSVLTIFFIVHTILFYTLIIDYNNKIELILYQSIIRSQFSLYSTLLVFLLVHFIYVYTSRRKYL